mmetsp:Transcript_8865/g.8946  ORF Transcript_8865/g.8946 Transcript_8865/m.8946 type:complete len:564 (-) Transcript_8865:351-2042(-)
MRQLIVVVCVFLLVASSSGSETASEKKGKNGQKPKSNDSKGKKGKKDSKSSKGSKDLLIHAPAGKFLGTYSDDKLRWWSGIPYAQPPVDNLRFEPPVALSKMTKTYTADYLSPGCMQPCESFYGVSPLCPPTTSEDCLYLTITAPKKSPKKKKLYAVMIWLHPGSFFAGFGANSGTTDPSMFAQNDIIVVSINYRLGALGFLGVGDHGGNYGFLDQQMAMQWVQRNIESFGGDPEKVTLMGGSAGAMSVGLHLISPASNGLFSAAIMQSNPIGFKYASRDETNDIAQYLMGVLGCADIDCMRLIPAETLETASLAIYSLHPGTYIPYSPVVEAGGDIPVQPYDAMKAVEYTDIPLLVGFTSDEGIVFEFSRRQTIVSEADYPAAVTETYGAAVQPFLLPLYPFSGDDARDMLSDIGEDYQIMCPILELSKLAVESESHKSPIYMYEFGHIYENTVPLICPAFCQEYACHQAEVPFVFGTFTQSGYTPTDNEIELSVEMNLAWSNFIKKGNPNKKKKLSSESYIPFTDNEDYLFLKSNKNMHTNYRRKAICDEFWDPFGVYPAN